MKIDLRDGQRISTRLNGFSPVFVRASIKTSVSENRSTFRYPSSRNMSYDEIDSEFRFPPDWGSSIFSWSRPRFESVFVLLHPFIRVPQELWQFLETDCRSLVVVDLDNNPYDRLLSSNAEHLPWKHFMNKLAISSYSTFVDIVQAYEVGAFALKSAQAEQLPRLEKLLQDEKVLSPATHCLPPTLKPKIRASLDKFGHGAPRWSSSPFEKDNILYATPYECAYSFICGARDLLQELVAECQFEGFFADSDTKFDWTDGANHQPGSAHGAMAFNLNSEVEEG